MNADSRRAVLITGASSGIGRYLAEDLAGRGHTVYATAREPQDLERLDEIENVQPVRMDVRDADQVQGAADLIARGGTGLYGIVNNAGIGVLGFLHTFSDDDLRDIFEINVFGPHRVTNAFLDLLIESKGRVVNMGSQGGSIAMKYFGPYCMTKFALEAYTIALDQELEPRGVRASVVQPGGIVSEIYKKASPRTEEHFRNAKPAFREEANRVMESFREPFEFDDSKPESARNRRASSPEIVAVAVRDALFSKKPRLRYLVGTEWEGSRVLNGLIERFLDANQSPEHGYSREDLVAMLDRHLAERSTESATG